MFEGLRSWWARLRNPVPVLAVGDLEPWQPAWDNGSKWSGGFGTTQVLTTDYWTLRARSSQLFETNLYARGVVRRLVTNIINTGLHLEATPEAKLLGLEEDALVDWSETVENRFELWGRDPLLCDAEERRTFGAVQAQALLEAVVAGDVLVVLLQDRRTQLPRVRLINASSVQTPMNARAQRGGRIVHGVEIDPAGHHVAYWVTQLDGTSKRLPAYGEKSGRRIAWLFYGTDGRVDNVRGKPLLSMILQSLAEIDRYRDSVQRKAVINAMIAMFIKKTADKPGSRPITGGAIRKGTQATVDSTGTQRRFATAEHIPGLVLEELQVGEEPEGFVPNGTDEKFADFEAAIVNGIAWSLQIPPEILTLQFSNNYSASQAAINEFKIFLNAERTRIGNEFCQYVYQEWLVSEVLAQKTKADGLVEAWRDTTQYDVLGAWMSADWSGHVKPSTDMLKQTKGYQLAISEGLITRDRAARELTGTKYSKNAKKLATENALLKAALDQLPQDQTESQPAKARPASGASRRAPTPAHHVEPTALAAAPTKRLSA